MIRRSELAQSFGAADDEEMRDLIGRLARSMVKAIENRDPRIGSPEWIHCCLLIAMGAGAIGFEMPGCWSKIHPDMAEWHEKGKHLEETTP